jgi:hypothetical protein
MDGSAKRTNSIFRLDENYIQEVKRELRLKQFNLNNYLPNTLKKHTRESSLEKIPKD